MAEGADIGLAFDGDADRVILSDEKGRKVDGDRVMLLVGRHLAAQGKLTNNTVVGTIMSNMGLEVALRESGLTLLRTAVGDRYVSEAMRRDGHVLGGEKSGHLIFGHLTTTGDGLLTALQVLKVMRETGQPLSALADQMTEYPQVLLGVQVRDRQSWASDPDISKAIAARRRRACRAGAGSMSAPPARKSWCASWRKARTRPRSTRWPMRSPRWCRRRWGRLNPPPRPPPPPQQARQRPDQGAHPRRLGRAVAGIQQGQAARLGLPELVVAHVAGHIRLRPRRLRGFGQPRPRAAADRHARDHPASGPPR